MFIIKNNYYLYIENTLSINLDHTNKNKKISIIYRNNGVVENLAKLVKFHQGSEDSHRVFFNYVLRHNDPMISRQKIA